MSDPIALIVEDDPERATMLRQAVESMGFSVELVQDGWSALMKLACLTPDVVILKPLLPVVSGAEIAAHVRADGRQLEARIVMISSTPVSGRARDLADVVVEAPLDEIRLKKTLRPLRNAAKTRQQVQTPGSPPISAATQVA